MKIYNIADSKFQTYGRIVEGYDFTELISVMRQRTIPKAVEYVASAPDLEALPVFRQFAAGFYGGIPVELGYCMGHNRKLNALEYHRRSIFP